MPKTDISVRELVDKVQRRELVLPEMQRRYVWPGTRVSDLLDSLYRGYPSGTILVWETDEEVETRELAVKSTKIPITSQKLLLLDGQQRVTSLAAIVNGEPVFVRKRKKPIDILFNLEHPEGPPTEVTEVEEDESSDIDDTEDAENGQRDIQEELKKRAFVVAGRALKNDPLWVSVSDVFKKSDKEVLKPIGITSEDERWDKYSERLQRVRKIAEYQYVMQVLESNMSYEEVTEIFVRVNSLGIKLRGSDLALAQITSRWKGFMGLVEDLAARFKEDEDYILETNLPVRLLVALVTHQSRFKTVGKINIGTFQKTWAETKLGLEFAVNFVRSNAAIEGLSLLSSPFLLIPIAVYWQLKGNGSLSKQEDSMLLKWLYLAHMRGHYGMGSSESILDQDLAILYKGGTLSDLINQLFLHVKKFTVDADDLAYKGQRSAFFSMMYFVLRQDGVQDWWSGLQISIKHVGKAHSIQFHHIFPKSLLKNASYEKKEINEIANMAFIGGKTNRHISNKEPITYLENEVIPKRGKEALASHLIPYDQKLLTLGGYKDFLAWRRKAIANKINAFMKRFE